MSDFEKARDKAYDNRYAWDDFVDFKAGADWAREYTLGELMQIHNINTELRLQLETKTKQLEIAVKTLKSIKELAQDEYAKEALKQIEELEQNK